MLQPVGLDQIHLDRLSNYIYSFWKQPASSFFRNNNYCFPDQGNVGHHTKKVTEKWVDLFIKYFLRLILCGFLLPRKYVLFNLQSLIKKARCITKLHKSTTDLILANTVFSNHCIFKVPLLMKLVWVIITNLKQHLSNHLLDLTQKLSTTENCFSNDLKETYFGLPTNDWMIVMASFLILSLKLPNVIRLWKIGLSEEIRSLLWTRNWERWYIIDEGLEIIYVKTLPKKEWKEVKY